MQLPVLKKVERLFARFAVVVSVCLAVLTVSGPAQVLPPEKYDLSAKPAPNSSVSYFDLIRQIFTDAQIDEGDSSRASANGTIPLRDLFWDAFAQNYGGEISLSIDNRVETIDGRDRIVWLLISAAQPDKPGCTFCFREILAAFRFAADGTPGKLLDAANIKTDDVTGFDETRPVVKLGSRREAVLVWNLSQLSQMSHNAFSVITADKNGFKLHIDQFDEQRDWRCGEWFGEETKMRILKTTVGGYRSIEILVRLEAGPDVGMDDNPVKLRRRFLYRYVWQPRRQRYRAVVNPERKRRALLKKIEPCRNNKY